MAAILVRRGTRRVLGIAALALLSSLQPGCREAPRRDHLTVAYPRGLATVEPNHDVEEFSQSILGNIFEGLVDIDENMALKPALAESWYSPDENTWIFRLRAGVRLHDGRPIAAADVASCLEALRRDGSRELAPAVVQVAEISAPDGRTVVLRTRSPFPSLPYHLAGLMISVPGAPGGAPLGTGPYVLRQRTSTGDVTLGAFPEYWGGRPKLETLEFKVLPRPEDRVRALLEKRVDLIVDVPADALAGIGRERGLRTLSARGLRVIFLGFDTGHEELSETGRNPLRDVRVRRAVALAIDRQALVRDALGGHAEVVDQIIAPEVFGYSAGLPALSYDPAAARRLLAEAGWPDGFALTLDVAPEHYRAVGAVALAVARDLAEVRIRATVRSAATDAFFSRLEKRESPLFLMGWISSGDAPLSYDYLLRTTGGGHGSDNFGGYSDPEIDRLLDAAELESAAVRRAENLKQVAARVLQALPVVPLYRQHDLYAFSDALDFKPRPDRLIRGFDIRWAVPAR